MPLVKNYELTTEDYEFGFDDGNGLALSLDTIPTLPSANLGAALKEYLLSLPRLKSIFRTEIEYYNRQDHIVRSLPALNIYIGTGKHEGPYGWLEGNLDMKIILPIGLNREVIADQAVAISNYIFLQMNQLGSIEFVSQYVKGLVHLGYNPLFNYDKAYILDGQQVDAYIVEGVANYKISMLEYYESLWLSTEYTGSNINVNIAP